MIPLAEQPEYVAKIAEVSKLSDALTKVQNRLAQIDSDLAHSMPDPHSAHVKAALHFAQHGEVQGTGNSPSALNDERSMLVPQEQALKRALNALHLDMHAIASRLSRDASKAVEKEHRKLARRAADALLAIDALAKEEDDLIGRLHSLGYEASFRQYVAWHQVGRMTARSESTLWHRHRELDSYAG
jgi:hypothetical protein